ncbi:unnamed protein product [Brassicogethes aeneus]|uniref:DUF4817 domain-containing protein n=1 Tax=Brassicogethes aeneus TaxID=1431903 RepID=A0A9P0FHT0_BRAAE|nr:unnamed protein product [Brassicogethes aeneus]
MGRNLHETKKVFNERYPKNPICRKYLRDLVAKFQTSGSVGRQKRSGRKSISEEKQVQIVGSVVNIIQQSTAAVAEPCVVFQTTVRKYLKKNKFYPYKL